MNKTHHQDFQRQITTLIPIVEMYLPLIKEVEQSHNKLNLLPNHLVKLKQKLELFELESAQKAYYDSPFIIQETESELDFLVDDLESILIHLTIIDRQVKNLIAMNERLEAVQEERIGNFTPERFHKILKRRQQLSSQSIDNTPSNKSDRLHSLWQKIVNYKSGKKLAIGTAIILGIVLFFRVASQRGCVFDGSSYFGLKQEASPFYGGECH